MADHAHDHDSDSSDRRITSPMQAFSAREAGIGFAVLLVGLLIAYVVPALV